MSGILDYAGKDTPFSRLPFGAVDGLILSELAMCGAWEGTGLIRDLPPDTDGRSPGFQAKEDQALLAMAISSERYGPLRFSDFTASTGEDTQFAAVTFHFPDESLFIAFRGTDRSLAGWEEDCRMFQPSPIPSQQKAGQYLERIAAQYPGRIMIGGHSKGGNLAMYAFSEAGEDIRQRVSRIFSYDGPGLTDSPDPAQAYARMGNRLHFYLTRGSVVGLLAAHPDHYRVIRSRAWRYMQHNPYTWLTEGYDFRYADTLSRGSRKFERVFQQWSASLNGAPGTEFVDTIFLLLRSTQSDVFGKELRSGLIRNFREVRSSLKGLSKETKGRFRRTLLEFIKLAAKAGGGRKQK